MNEVEVTWGNAAKVWWSIMWRLLLFCGIAGFVAGFIIGFVGAIIGTDRELVTILGGLAGGVVSIPVGIWVVKVVLGKRYSNFRVALVAGG